ncbi:MULTISPECIES: hypothetical protein [Arsenicicoccus]|nr:MULTISPECIES: hypothetical protein [Arsenicicoccus]
MPPTGPTLDRPRPHLATCRETAGRDLQDPADDPYPDAPAHA